MTKAEEFLYYYEHKLIPDIFFHSELDLFGTLAQHPEALYGIFADAAEKNGVEHPYTETQFRAEGFRMDETWFAVVLTFPKPKKPAFCHQMYLFSKADHTGKGCFTLEHAKDIKGNPGLVIGGWDAEESHLNYGFHGMEKADYCAMAFEIHKKANGGE